jgi:hypothetical protein
MTKTILKRLEYALKYPFQNDDSPYRAILIGGLMILLTPLIIPLFIVFGYQLRVYESSLKGEDRPKFTNVFDLLVYGLKSSLIITPALILVSLVSYIPTVLKATGAVPLPSPVYSLLLLTFSILSALLTPIFILMHIDTNGIKDTYDISRLVTILTDKKYVIGYLVFLLISITVQFLLLIPSLLIITVPFISMYSSIFVAAYLGDLFKQFSEMSK